MRWESTGTGEYTLETVEDAARGTAVTLHLKADEDEFLQSWQLRSLIARYSDHIGFPIRMPKEKDGKPTDEWEVVNQASALWTRPKSELKDEDYQGFYKHIAHDFNDRAGVDAQPRRGQPELHLAAVHPVASRRSTCMMGARDERKGLKLYVKRVFIMDAAEQLLPAYLRFVRGVVDSDDLPLNVSREILQQNRNLEKLQARPARGACSICSTSWPRTNRKNSQRSGRNSAACSRKAWPRTSPTRSASPSCCASPPRKAEGAAQTVSLDDYIGRMKAGQESIYYITADGYAAAKGSPQLEALQARAVSKCC